MNYWIRFILVSLVGFFSVIFDISFFSLIELGGTTVLSSFALITVFALFGRQREVSIISAILALALSLLSSLPVWFILFGFVILPNLLLYLKTTYLHDSSLYVVYLLSCLACLIFEGVLLLGTKSWGLEALAVLGYFTLLNSLTTFLFYLIAKKTRETFLRGVIKI